MSFIVSVANHKGGVGKTTTTANLGAAISLTGKKVLLIDLDPQANLSQSLGFDESEPSISNALLEESNLRIEEISDYLHLAPASLDLLRAEKYLSAEGVLGYDALRRVLASVNVDQYFITLIDCPPDLGILTQNALISATHCLVVVEPRYFSVKGLDTIITLLEKMRNFNTRLNLIGIVVSKSDRTVLSSKMTDYYEKTWKDKVFSKSVRLAIAVAEASEQHMHIFDYLPHSTVAEDYREICEEFLRRIEVK